MKTPIRFTLLLLVLTSISCAHNVTRMSRNLVGGPQPTRGDLSLNVEKTGKGESATYDLFVRWFSTFRLDVQPGKSLFISADGKEMAFTAAADIYHDSDCGRGPCVYEDRAYYPATAEQIRTISNAASVLVQVVGSKQTVSREFNETNFEAFRNFVSRHLAEN
jgi:hypothetical protein